MSAAFGVLGLAMDLPAFDVRPTVRVELLGGETGAVGEGQVVFDAVVHSEVIVDVRAGEVVGLWIVALDGDVDLVLDGVERGVGRASAVGQFNELDCHDVVWQRTAGAERVVYAGDGEGVAPAGFDELGSSDGESLGAVLAGAVLEGAAVWSGVPGMWLLAVCDGFRHALEAFAVVERHEPVGGESGFAALLVNVVWGVNFHRL